MDYNELDNPYGKSWHILIPPDAGHRLDAGLYGRTYVLFRQDGFETPVKEEAGGLSWENHRNIWDIWDMPEKDGGLYLGKSWKISEIHGNPRKKGSFFSQNHRIHQGILKHALFDYRRVNINGSLRQKMLGMHLRNSRYGAFTIEARSLNWTCVDCSPGTKETRNWMTWAHEYSLTFPFIGVTSQNSVYQLPLGHLPPNK